MTSVQIDTDFYLLILLVHTTHALLKMHIFTRNPKFVKIKKKKFHSFINF